MKIRLPFCAVLALGPAALAACAGDPAPPPASTSAASATRDEFALLCEDSFGRSHFYRNLAESWQDAGKVPLTACQAEAPSAGVTLTPGDLAAVELTRGLPNAGKFSDAGLYANLVGTCAHWAGDDQNRPRTKADLDRTRGALLVCPDTPYAKEMQAFIDAATATGQP